MKNAMTIDVEDYFQVTAYRGCVGPADWTGRQSRLRSSTEKILELLESNHCRATFFVLGWVAEHEPLVVSQIAACGHEIACHSNEHKLVYEMSREQFRQDTRRAKEHLENVVGVAVRGYRAPSFSITQASFWAFEVLAELGFTYDSSIFPVQHPNYGISTAPRFPFRVNTPFGEIVEFPMPTLEWVGKRSPFGGGAYLRLLPYWYTRWGIRYLNTKEEQRACVYVHPWEFDPGQPRISGSFTARLRHHVGLRSTETKLRRLLVDFEFCPLGEIAAEIAGSGPCVAEFEDLTRSGILRE